MSVQPSDPATEAFERLRLEVALLRRAVEGLAADAQAEPVDYTPTLAELSEAVDQMKAQVAALGERPALALGPEHLGALLMQASAKLTAKPLAELERARAAFGRATEAFQAASEADLARHKSWRKYTAVAGGGVLAGALLWGLLAGPLARSLPASWRAPERLASATLALPMAAAGERLLARADPNSAQALRLAKSLRSDQRVEIEQCLRQLRSGERRTCTLGLRGWQPQAMCGLGTDSGRGLRTTGTSFAIVRHLRACGRHAYA